MINIILLSLTLVPAATSQTAQVRPCVWPNVCKIEAPAVAQFRPCVWPNVCKTEAPAVPAEAFSVIEVAQVTTCVYPRKCNKNA